MPAPKQSVPSVDPDKNPKLAQWLSSDQYHLWLRMMLDSEEGKLLVDVLREFSSPSTKVGELYEGNATDLLTKLALTQAIHSGQRNNIETLLSLRHKPEEVYVLTHDGWEGQALAKK